MLSHLLSVGIMKITKTKIIYKIFKLRNITYIIYTIKLRVGINYE